MADIHCHALGGVDDGAKNTDEMKTMMDMAYADGIRHICYTPHFKTYHFKNEDSIKAYNAKIAKSFAVAQEYASEKYQDLSLYLGNEIMYHSELIDSSDANLCKRINNGAYLLVEFQPETPFYDIRNAVSKILRRGFTPVIAHVERYTELVKRPELTSELKDFGALFQINASSLEGFGFGKTAKFIKYLFKKVYVDVVASDAHDSVKYTPILSRAAAKITKQYGEAMAKRVLHTVPLSIIQNKKLF